MTTMQPLTDWPAKHRRAIVGVFTDIDDTLTTDGVITADALHALTALKKSGLHVIAITGRPVGWSEPFAESWPVDAIVAENGAVALVNPGVLADGASSAPLRKLYQQDTATRIANLARMQQVAERVLREVPGAILSRDSSGRETDIAVDHSEFSHLDADKIARTVSIMRSEGMSATVSSIHVNGWFGSHNKLVGARWIVCELFGRTLANEMDRWAYVGDSTNDQVMFEAFAQSVGVANITRFTSELSHFPRYVTQRDRGAGFAEFAAALLTERSRCS